MQERDFRVPVMLVGIVLVVAILCWFFLTPAHADTTAISGSQSGSYSSSGSQANSSASTKAYSGGNSQSTVYNSPAYDGNVSGLNFSSGHPCAYSPLGASLSIIGAGVTLGGQLIDDTCLLAELGYRKAAMLMIASRNPLACANLRLAGEVASCPGDDVAAATMTSTMSAPEASYRSTHCVFNNAGKLVKVFFEPGQTRKQAIAACN